MKLRCMNIHVKDNLTLAYYNILSGTIIDLQLKERGGRRNWNWLAINLDIIKI